MMLVSHPYRFIYLKSRKTAGTSVEMALEPLAAPDPDDLVEEYRHAVVSARGIVGMRLPMIHQDKKTALDRLWWNHMPAAALRDGLQRDLPGQNLWLDYLRVATVRNPFDRLVSMYFWDGFGSTDALEKGCRSRVFTMSFTQIRDGFLDFIRANAWDTDEDILCLEGKICIDRVLRYENLTADLAIFLKELGVAHGQGRIPKTKVTQDMRQGRAVADFFDPETIDLVRRRFGWLIEAIGYPDQPCEAAVRPGG